jgi:hypothetical protein
VHRTNIYLTETEQAGLDAPDLDADGPVVTPWRFQFRMARAVSDSTRSGSLSRRLADPEAAARGVLHLPSNRLVVLDPRSNIDDTVRVALTHRANLLLAELVGAAVSHQASVRLTRANVGRTWPAIMEAESIDLAIITV